jgi:anti-sigma factor (TIGR02949 family)
MKLDCKHVWAQLSEYIDGSVEPGLRREIEEHLAHCRHCAAIYDSAHNILVLVGDERTFEVPVGFGERLHTRLQQWMDAEGSSA